MVGLLWTPVAIANPLAELALEDRPLYDQELTAGRVRVVITAYEPKTAANADRDNLRYEIYVDNDLKAQVQDEVFRFSFLGLENLDRDDIPEVVVSTFTGGAHCCTITTLYSWQGDRLHRTRTYPLDASGGGTFEDLNGDGYSEFISADTRFLYSFSSYAGSFPPTVILSFRGGYLVDVTRQFPETQRSQAYSMYERIRTGDVSEVNGTLAGYVAQKILLGEYEDGWNYMLAHYDRDDEWGLEVTNANGEVVAAYPDFPAALEAFLIELGYLTVNGEPNPGLDLSKPIVEQHSLL